MPQKRPEPCDQHLRRQLPPAGEPADRPAARNSVSSASRKRALRHERGHIGMPLSEAAHLQGPTDQTNFAPGL